HPLRAGVVCRGRPVFIAVRASVRIHGATRGLRMSHTNGLDRRSFLRNAGLTALAGAVSTRTSLAATAGRAFEPAADRYDFDTVYNRFGTNSVKFDQQIRVYGKDSVQVGMGIADMDFRAAPSITKALKERLEHENWGYLDMGAAGDDMAKNVVSW